ncbi:MAG: hypothetical protein CO108_09295 [Deltaproteobacteria bacterium CG_4_9_14_3_um_filter_63_12]|nr:MAG: hypothetical protein CO108_09295 [Deltaproteobacteria bacterium CG_4_9_14_3_um_filter_63_12]
MTMNDSPLKFDCTACGRCCESWTVGPVSKGEADRLGEFRRLLSDQYPRLAAHETTQTLWTEEGWTLTLNFPGGRCLFLGEDRLCIVHKEYGFDAKPAICRRFPLAAVTAEGELREGIRPLSYGLAGSYQAGSPVDLDSVELRDDRRAAVISARFELEPELQQALIEQERELMAWLPEPKLSFAELLSRLAGAAPTTQRVLPPLFLSDVAKRLSVLPKLWKRPQNTESQFEALLQDLYALLAALPSWALAPSHLELPEAQRHYLMFSLLQLVRIRDLLHYPSVRIAVFGLALGALVARGAPDSPSTDALFAERFVTWGRFFTERKMVSVFPDYETLEGLFQQLRESTSSGS